MNRTEVVALFRERLLEIIERSGLSRSAFAQKIQLDRSTLSQLLSAENERLARAETILAIATEGAVSIDWLLGRSQEEGQGAALVANAMQIEPGADVPVDERLQRWHAEAAGYKIRYVPASLPDLLKTQDVIDFEYGTRSSDTAQNRWEETEARLAYSRLPETDMEVCTTFQSIEAFAAGGGIWDGLSEEARAGQLDHMIRSSGPPALSSTTAPGGIRRRQSASRRFCALARRSIRLKSQASNFNAASTHSSVMFSISVLLSGLIIWRAL